MTTTTRRITGGAILAAGAIATMAGCAGTGTTHHDGHATAAPAAATSSPAAAPSSPPPPAPDSQGTYTGSCDYTLANSPYADDHLAGEVDVTNTGNIGTVVHVRISWPQEGYPPITARKTVHVATGATKAVRFHVSAGSIAGGSNVISNLQAWEQGHNYPGNDCKYRADITGTFGQVQG